MQEKLLHNLLPKKSVWAIDVPQIYTTTCIDITRVKNAEVDISLHSKFECVWLFGTPVNFYCNWRQIVLSGLKLLSKNGGFLVITSYDVFALKQNKVLKFLKQFLVSYEEKQTYFESKTGYRVTIFEISKLIEDLPLNSTFITKSKKISKCIIKFYKTIYKFSIKR